MDKIETRFQTRKDIALARFEIEEEVNGRSIPLEERLGLIEEAKHIVDQLYQRYFGGKPLPFLLVIEEEYSKNPEEQFTKGPGLFMWLVDPKTNLIVPSVTIWYPITRFSRLDGEQSHDNRINVLKEWYKELVMHESAHLHNQADLNFFRPKWLDEGLATFVELEHPTDDKFHMDPTRLDRAIRRASELSNLPDFKPLYAFHEYDKWVELNPDKTPKRDNSYYDMAYLLVREMLCNNGNIDLSRIEIFRKMVEEYSKPVHVQTKRDYFKDTFGLVLPEQLSLTPEQYRRLEDPMKITSSKSGIQPQQIDLEAHLTLNGFDESFQRHFPTILIKYGSWIKS